MTEGHKGAEARIALWCLKSEVRRALGGRPADPDACEATVATLRAMTAAVRQREHAEDGQKGPWTPTGRTLQGVDGLKATLSGGYVGKTRMRRIWLDVETVGLIASASTRITRDLEEAKATTMAREIKRRAALKMRRAEAAAARSIVTA